eukprot:Hpha_TRINITY_DN5172_c0_g1::TRINITY_DN5172_c0_g1_i1::g.193094::m.193094
MKPVLLLALVAESAARQTLLRGQAPGRGQSVGGTAARDGAGQDYGVYDCPMRGIAADYARDVVLAPWPLERAAAVAELVAGGLRVDECPPAERVASPAKGGGRAAAAGAVEIFVSPGGDDAANGTLEAPLRTPTGARQLIRSRYPDVAKRPGITVRFLEGDYFFGLAGPSHLEESTGPSTTSLLRLTDVDSGSSADTPVTYAAGLRVDGTPERVRFVGGANLSGLVWEPASTSSGQPAFPPGVMKTTLPPGVSIDAQDQLYMRDGRPLVRARTPNGRPWMPLDGYNLSVAAMTGTMVPAPVFTSCANPAGSTPVPPHNTPPRPGTPQPGHCSTASNVTLLFGYPNIPGVLLASTTSPSADACGALCLSNPCCNGYTWHDKSTGMFFQHCYHMTDPNLDPWKFAVTSVGHQAGLCKTASSEPVQCFGPSCLQVDVVCGDPSVPAPAFNATQVDGFMGTSSAASAALAGLGGKPGVVPVAECLEHPLGLANDWPHWKAASYGMFPGAVKPLSLRTLDQSQNFPLWFGPWASGIKVDTSQNAGWGADGPVNMSAYTWKDAASVVVHAMADGEWGGTQFQASSGTPASGRGGNATLQFSYGGFQQARGATLYQRNRFYMEGSGEFLDAPGEWWFDAATRNLYLYPEADGGASLAPDELVLTQTDVLVTLEGSGSAIGSRVQHVAFENLSFAFTSAQFFRPHEESSGGDYAVHRAGAITAENVTDVRIDGNTFEHIGGNAVFFSNSVHGAAVRTNLFRFLGTSGVSVVGRTGAAMLDARDGEAMMAQHGGDPAYDNGVRLPRDVLVEHNVFTDYGVWDKQSACFHKALAPGNITFRNNVCFNSSRHAINFQDSLGGGAVVEGNLFFNLNRESKDTAALNSWHRRHYLTSDPRNATVGRLVPTVYNQWRRNLILNRNFYGVRDGNGNGIRNDDGASWYEHTGNVLYRCDIEFNGGTQITTRDNLYFLAGRTLLPTPDVLSMYNDTFVDSTQGLHGSHGCPGIYNQTFVNATRPGMKVGIYRGDFSTGVVNSTGSLKPGQSPDWSTFWCGMPLAEWQKVTGQDASSTQRVSDGTADEFSSGALLARARRMMWDGQ